MATAVLLKAIEVLAPAELQAAMAGFGRTEDVGFSPDNRRLAIAGFALDRLFLLDVDLDGLGGDGAAVTISGITEVRSAGLHDPHGLSFADDQTLVVANRTGDVTIFTLPPPVAGSRVVGVDPVATIDAPGHGLAAPGSLSIATIAPELHVMLVCNNAGDTVTRHVVDTRAGVRVLSSRVALADGLAIPDGVAVSGDGRWVAISNHCTQSVLLFRNDSTLGPQARPNGTLRGVAYPHGLRFTPDGRFLVVADAGTPHVHVYGTADGDWSGDREPIATVQLMDDDVFQRGRHNPEEGGPKGLAIDRDARLLVVTSEHQPLAAFDLRDVVGDSRPPRSVGPVDAPAGEATRTVVVRALRHAAALESTVTSQDRRLAERDAELHRQALVADGLRSELSALRTELGLACAAAAHERARADDGARQLEALRHSTSWRATAPARFVTARLRRIGRASPRCADAPQPARSAPA